MSVQGKDNIWFALLKITLAAGQGMDYSWESRELESIKLANFPKVLKIWEHIFEASEVQLLENE